jgi:hypothetical protein
MGRQILESTSYNRQSKDNLLTNPPITIGDVVWLSCFRSLIRCTRAKPAPWRGLFWYAIERRDHSQCIFYLHSRGVQDAHRRGSCRYQNLSVTFVSYTLQKCDWPYSAVESAQPGPSFEKLRLRNLWCCPDLTSLNLRAMEWCQHLWLRVVKLWTSSKCVEEECMPRLHHLKLGANYILESTPKIWRCTKLVCVENSRYLKLLLQCMDVKSWNF